MESQALTDLLKQRGITFYTGVPDSLLGGLCNYLMETVGIASNRHVIAHNEGGCVGLAAGHYLATGTVPCVYLQNSGVGNVLNPAASLCHPKVYGIPVLYLVGWRGEPGVKDEPQHLYQGEATLEMLDSAEIPHFILEKDTDQPALAAALDRFAALFAAGKSAAIVVRKGALTGPKVSYGNEYTLNREAVIGSIAQAAGSSGVLVSTTGKISRELFEYREQLAQGHAGDFLTVGSMGHSVMIALGIAAEKPDKRIWCLDGDGAALMHLGALATVGSQQPENLVHIVLNNAAHESVGGAPTVAGGVDLASIAAACGYRQTVSVTDHAGLSAALEQCRAATGPVFLEVRVALGSRDDLGRPTTTPEENKAALMACLEADR